MFYDRGYGTRSVPTTLQVSCRSCRDSIVSCSYVTPSTDHCRDRIVGDHFLPCDCRGIAGGRCASRSHAAAQHEAPLGGYGERMNRPAEGVHDRIFAKALVIS